MYKCNQENLEACFSALFKRSKYKFCLDTKLTNSKCY